VAKSNHHSTDPVPAPEAGQPADELPPEGAPEQPKAVPPDDAADELNHDIAQLRARLEEAKDRALRFQAELDNYRKRVNRQMEEERRYAGLPVIRDVLPVLDNVNRAIDAAQNAADAAKLLEGFRMVARQLQSVCERHHCTEIAALHQPFDPHLHEAITQQPSGDFPPNTVLCVLQPGFRMHDRVVRPSHVIVSAPGAPANDGEHNSI
jgi:molecular chaperone GrpE